MAIEGVKSFVAAANYPQTQPVVKTQPSEDTAERMEADKASVTGQPVEIKKVDESAGQNKDGSTGDQAKQNQKQMSEEEVRQKLKDINKKINSNTIAEFGMHEGTNRITIKLKDKDTDEIIKEFPAEKTLDLIQKAWELAGILVDEKR